VPTRFYLASTGSAPVAVPYSDLWTKTGQAVRRPCTTTGNGTALTNFTTTESFGTQETILVVQFVSAEMPAQTISTQELKTVLIAHEAATAAGAYLMVLVRVVTSDGATQRNVLWTTPAGSFGLGTAVRTYAPLGTYSGSTTLFGGERIVIEYGWDAQNTTSTTQSVTLRFGDTGTDYAYTSGLTSISRRPCGHPVGGRREGRVGGRAAP
jgi:hypothetical protein